MSDEVCRTQVRRTYNGYRFHPQAESVYNPFSTFQLLRRKEFGDYWFQTGTPTFLVELLKRSDIDLRDLEGIQLDAADFADYRADPDRPLPVIYQSGYLTIRDFEPRFHRYTLGYPNDEVRRGFLKFLLPSYTGISRDTGGLNITRFVEELEAGDVDAFLTRLRSFFAAIPYELNDQTERHYQVVFYLVFSLMGQFTGAEVRSAKGRADAVVWTPTRIFVFEFKLAGTAEEALAQIDAQGYCVPYEADGRTIVKVSVEFDKAASSRHSVAPSTQENGRLGSQGLDGRKKLVCAAHFQSFETPTPMLVAS